MKKSAFLNKLIPVILIVIIISAITAGVYMVYELYGKAPETSGKYSLVLNEVSYKKSVSARYNNAESSDWVEIYNFGDSAVDLSGFGLSDDADSPYRYTFPKETELEGKSYLLVYLSSDQSAPVINTGLSAGFGLSEEETALLTDREGNTIDLIKLPAGLDVGFSVGRTKNNCNTWAILTTPTPGEFNHSSVHSLLEQYSDMIDPPEFSKPGGIYKDEFFLSITSSDPSAEIYYTTDGSEPDKSSSKYTEPILIKDRSEEKNKYVGIETSALYYGHSLKTNNTPVYKGSVIRAKCFKNGMFSESTATQTYFINPSYTFPIISVVTDPVNLFDEDSGIYVPGKKMKLWKKYNPEIPTSLAPLFVHYNDRNVPAYIEMYDTDGTCIFQDNVGLCISGNTTSYQRCKNLAVKCSKNYGSKSIISYDIFNGTCTDLNGKKITSFKNINFRTSGGGGVYDGTMLKDAYLQRLVKPIFDTTLSYRPSIVFIDGEYWGIHNIRERYSSDYFYYHYGVEKNNLMSFKRDDDTENKDVEDFKNIVSKITALDLTDNKNYEIAKEYIDIDNLINYFAIECYLNNADFFGKNVGLWRCSDDDNYYADTRWRFMLYDLDAAFENQDFELLEQLVSPDNNLGNYSYVRLFRVLLKNDEFFYSFINKLLELGETVFRPETAVDELNEMLSVVAPEIKEHYSRWQLVRSPIGKLLEFFSHSEVADMYENYENSKNQLQSQIESRPQEVKDLVEAVFGITVNS